MQLERAGSNMLCAVDYIFNLLCAFNYLKPMKKLVFSVRPEPLVGYKLSRVALGTRMGSTVLRRNKNMALKAFCFSLFCFGDSQIY